MQDNRENPTTHDKSEDVSLDNMVEILSFRALHDNDPLTRRNALSLLGKTQDPDCIDTCIKAMRDPEKAVRCQAAHALAEIGEPASEKLILLLDDSDWRIRYRAAEALGHIKDKRAVTPLIKRLSDEKDHVRYMAAKSLGEIGAPETIDSILSVSNDENPYVRRMAGNVLKKLKSG
jgi:HEAT repeat protein